MTKAKNEKMPRQSLLPQLKRAVVAPDEVGSLKRRAEELGLIIHARRTATGGARKQQDARKK